MKIEGGRARILGGRKVHFLPVLCKLKGAGVYSREGFVKAWRLFNGRKYDCLAINGDWGRVRMGCYTRLNYVYATLGVLQL